MLATMLRSGVLAIMLALGSVTASQAADEAIAIFAGGCFWCVESDFDRVPGVLRTTSGYTGGEVADPNYKQVTAGGTGHREAVEIAYDPAKVSYETLLDMFWHSVDPTDGGGQFCDRGHSYSTAIYATSEEQLKQANASKQTIDASGVLPKPIVTEIVAAGPFYPAEDYHQDFYTRNPVRYKVYRYGCGRDARLEELWGEDAMRGMTAKDS